MALFDDECPLRDVVPYLIRPSKAVAALLKVFVSLFRLCFNVSCYLCAVCSWCPQPLLEQTRNRELIALQMRLGTPDNYFEPGPIKTLARCYRTHFASVCDIDSLCSFFWF